MIGGDSGSEWQLIERLEMARRAKIDRGHSRTVFGTWSINSAFDALIHKPHDAPLLHPYLILTTYTKSGLVVGILVDVNHMIINPMSRIKVLPLHRSRDTGKVGGCWLVPG